MPIIVFGAVLAQPLTSCPTAQSQFPMSVRLPASEPFKETVLRLIRALCAAVVAALTLVACGGGDPVSVNPGTSTTANETAATVSISGSPMTGIAVGSQYSFTPTASDSDGGKMTFSIQNAPAWASFNASTGQLSGSPKATDTGTTLNIVISVADGTATASLPAFSVIVTGTPANTGPTSGTATVSWSAPTENVNGTALTDLAGFNIYYGSSAGSLTQKVQVTNAQATSYVVNGLGQGTWYFVVTAYTSDGTESAQSSVGSKTIS
jgi:Putative Ig domain